MQDLRDLDADEAAPDDHRPFALLGAPVELFEVAERDEVMEAGPFGPRPGSGPSLGAHREQELVVPEATAVHERESVALRVDAGNPPPHALEPHSLVELAVERLGVLEPRLTGEDIHERGPREEVVVLVGHHADPRLGVTLAEGERRLHAADAVSNDHVVHGFSQCLEDNTSAARGRTPWPPSGGIIVRPSIGRV